MSAARCETGWGEGLSSETLPELRDHPTPPLRVDPPPPGEGRNGARSQLKQTSAFPRRDAPEFCQKLPALSTEGAGNAGRLVRPQRRVRR
jgi:hypothetical protein